MGVFSGPEINEDGLVLALDAANTKSYPSSGGSTWYDLSGNGNNGTITDATFNSDGYFAFDGSGDYVESGAASDWTFLHNGASDFTIELWIYLPASTVSYSICSTSGGSTNIAMNFKQVSSGSIHYLDCEMYGSGGRGSTADFGISTNALTEDNWNHATFTFDSSSKTVTYYINGVSSGSSSQSSFSYSSSNPYTTLLIGKSVYSTITGYYNGRISTVKIYKEKALTASEVKQNFNALRGRYGI